VLRHEANDQAAGLRRLLGNRNSLRPLGIFGPDADLNAIAAANLGLALSQHSDRVGLIDEAHAPYNATNLCALSPNHDLSDVLHGVLSLDEALTGAPDGPWLLKAECGFRHAAATDEQTWNRIGGDFAHHAWDWLLLAAPADEHPSLALAAPLRLLILPTVKARLTEAYVILKAAQRKQPDGRWLALFMNANDDAKVSQLMAALNATARQFLGIELEPLTAIPKDDRLDPAARALRPLLERSPASPSTEAIRRLTARLRDETDWATGIDAELFWQRMGLFSRLNQPTQYSKQHAQHSRAYG